MARCLAWLWLWVTGVWGKRGRNSLLGVSPFSLSPHTGEIPPGGLVQGWGCPPHPLLS